MNYVDCYDAVSFVLDDVQERFGASWKVNNNKLKKLKMNCNELDSVAQEFNCEAVEAEIDEDTMGLTISLLCEEMTFEYGRSNPFFKAIQWTNSFGFKQSEDGNLLVFFRYDGLFSRT